MKRDNFMVPNNAVAAAYPRRPRKLSEVTQPPQRVEVVDDFEVVEVVGVVAVPVAVAFAVTPMVNGRRWFRGSKTRGQVAAWLVEVECPYGCKRPHTHGSGGPELLEFVGHRASHCGRLKSANDRGYYVVVPSELVASAVAAVES